MHIVFDKLDNFYPFNENFSIYLHKISERFIGEIILENMLLNKKGNKYTSIFLKDPLLVNNGNFRNALRKYLPIREPRRNDDSINAVFYSVLSRNQPIILKYPWNLFAINDDYLSKLKRKVSNKAIIERNVEITGNVVIEEGVKILSGARIKGNIYIEKGSFIANNALIRGNAAIGKNCKVAFSSDIKDVIIHDNAGIGPLSFIGDSIVGYDFFCGGLVRFSNYRLDNKNVEVIVKDKKINTNRRFLGCFIGNSCSMGIGSVVLPGRKIGNKVFIGPHIILEKNIASNQKIILKQQKIIRRKNE